MAILILVPALLFVGTLSFDFVLDDNLVVLDDAHVVEPLRLGALFQQPVRILDVVLSFFRPVITLTYRADRILWGANPAGYHFSNVLWHLLVTQLVYCVALRTIENRTTAWLSALLFSVLPVHTEAVAWIQGRVDLVPTALVLIALLALVTAEKKAGPSMWRWSLFGGLTFFLALLAKESVATFPLAWAMWEMGGMEHRIWRQRLPGSLLRLGVLAIASTLYWGLRQHAVGGLSSLTLNSLSVSEIVAGAFAVIGEYGRLLLLPDLSLNFVRGLPAHPPAAIVVCGIVVCILIVIGLFWSWRRNRRLFPWIAWLAITLQVPLLVIAYVYVPGITFFTADRYLYLPSVGWCILIGLLLSRFLEAGVAEQLSRMIAVGALVVGYAGLTLLRLQPWSDPIEFLQEVKQQPGLSIWVQTVLCDNLGLLYLEKGDFEKAGQQILSAARLAPLEPSPRNNMGVLLIRQGRPAEAMPWLESAIRLNPGLASAYGNLGAAYESMGELARARAAFETGLRLAPGTPWIAQGLARVTGNTTLRSQ